MVFTVRYEGLLKSTCFASAKAVLLTNESSAFNEQKHCFSTLKTSAFKRGYGKRVDRRMLHKIHKGKHIFLDTNPRKSPCSDIHLHFCGSVPAKVCVLLVLNCGNSVFVSKLRSLRLLYRYRKRAMNQLTHRPSGLYIKEEVREPRFFFALKRLLSYVCLTSPPRVMLMRRLRFARRRA